MALTKPFAENGDKKAIPENTTGDGSLSYETGFGGFYALPPEEGGLFIDRAQFNQLMYDTTSQILENKQALSNLSGSTYTKTEVDNLVNTKANWNAVVKLTDDQTINGVKTFTSNITSPNITNLQNQVNNIAGNGSYPLLTKTTHISITAGAGGDFKDIVSALIYLKQNISQQLASIASITLLSDFTDNLNIYAYPFTININCNGFTLANNLNVVYSKLSLGNLKLTGQLNALGSFIDIYNGVAIGGNSTSSHGIGSSIVANGNSFVLMRSDSGNVTLTPPENQFGIYAKASRVYLVYPSTYIQSQGQYFAYVEFGGIISADGGVNLQSVTVTKTNVTVNTLTSNGIIFGNIWG